jgi:hypothetical protein
VIQRSCRERKKIEMFVVAGIIESSEVLANGTGCFLSLRPGNRLKNSPGNHQRSVIAFCSRFVAETDITVRRLEFA